MSHPLQNVLACAWKNGIGKRTDGFLHFREVQTQKRFNQNTCGFDRCLWEVLCLTLPSLFMESTFKSGKTDTGEEHRPCPLITVRNEQIFLQENKVIEEIP